MNANNIVAMLQNHVTVQVRFKDSNPNSSSHSKLYSYRCRFKDVKPGDEVVVDSPSKGMTVVVVEKVDRGLDVDAKFDYKHVVCKVETAEYEKLLELREEAIDEMEDVLRQARIDQTLETFRNSLSPTTRSRERFEDLVTRLQKS